MAGRVMLNPWIYGRTGRNPRRGRRRNETYSFHTGPSQVQAFAHRFRQAGIPVETEGVERVWIRSSRPREALLEQYRRRHGSLHGLRNPRRKTRSRRRNTRRGRRVPGMSRAPRMSLYSRRGRRNPFYRYRTRLPGETKWTYASHIEPDIQTADDWLRWKYPGHLVDITGITEELGGKMRPIMRKVSRPRKANSRRRRSGRRSRR